MSPAAVHHRNHPGIVSSISLMLCAAPAIAQLGNPGSGLFSESKPHATMRLATEHNALTPGENELAIIFTIDDHWHLYWKNPGDTGLPPSITLNLPPGIEQTGDIRWPAPKRYPHGGGQFLDYIYEHELALLIPITVEPGLTGMAVEINTNGSWLVCNEACIPGEGSASLQIPVQPATGTTTSDAPIIAAARERIPEFPNNSTPINAHWNGLTLELTVPGATSITVFPLEPTLGGPVDPITEAISDSNALNIRFDPRTANAQRVVLVVQAQFTDGQRFTTLELPAPRPVE